LGFVGWSFALFGFKVGFGFEVNGFRGFNFKVKVNIKVKVKGFRSPGATYFLFPEKKVGKESGLPGRQGQKRWDCLGCWFRRGACGSAGILPVPVLAATVSRVVFDSWWRCMMAEAQALRAAAATGADGCVVGTVLVSWWARWPLFECGAERLKSNPGFSNPTHSRWVHHAHHETSAGATP